MIKGLYSKQKLYDGEINDYKNSIIKRLYDEK